MIKLALIPIRTAKIIFKVFAFFCPDRQVLFEFLVAVSENTNASEFALANHSVLTNFSLIFNILLVFSKSPSDLFFLLLKIVVITDPISQNHIYNRIFYLDSTKNNQFPYSNIY